MIFFCPERLRDFVCPERLHQKVWSCLIWSYKRKWIDGNLSSGWLENIEMDLTGVEGSTNSLLSAMLLKYLVYKALKRKVKMC